MTNDAISENSGQRENQSGQEHTQFSTLGMTMPLIQSGSLNLFPSNSTTDIDLQSIRQQIDESRYNMVNMLTQQMSTMFNPLIQNTQHLTRQLCRIADVLRAPPLNQTFQQVLDYGQSVPPNFTQREVQNFSQNEPQNLPQDQNFSPNEVLNGQENSAQNQPQNFDQNLDNNVLVNRNQNDYGGPQNVANAVEEVLNHHGFNVGYVNRPNFTSPFSEVVLQAELPRGGKVPKVTKFSGGTGESTVEHIARYLLEIGDLANNEQLKMKYFPSSLTKNAFTWFTTLPPNSIHNWNELEMAFHEQFFRGETKVSLLDLANVERQPNEPIDDYLIRFRHMEARCSTHVPEFELVKMAIGGLDYSIKKNLVNDEFIDMAQLAHKVRRVEKLRLEKYEPEEVFQGEESSCIRATQSPEIDQEEIDQSDEDSGSDENEVNMAEFKPKSPYTYEGESKGKFPAKLYKGLKTTSDYQKVMVKRS
ncbi:uncharacterized protein LOC130743492 [Lotus japonicus]|uniref:uncharacterized protein LOC130743492 n=1 Tax=Lotus japonicus TaxID=34305 RepID=UPI002582CBB6|nr:uncharacterized protein LOC130743492 [Lotus japonicus]